jgi:hypothetical protein
LGGLNGTDLEFIDPSTNDGESGIVSIDLMTPGGVVRLDYVWSDQPDFHTKASPHEMMLQCKK